MSEVPEMVERLARVMCGQAGRDPDELEPGNAPYYDDTEVVDGQVHRGPAFFLWRLYVRHATDLIRAMYEPTPGMTSTSAVNTLGAVSSIETYLDDFSAKGVWQGMIDEALGRETSPPEAG